MATQVVVGREEEIAPGQILRVEAGGVPIAIFNVHGELYAIGDTCTHEEFSLSDGDMVDDYTVECALHGAQFDIRTGEVLSMPATEPEVSYPVWVEDGLIKIELED
jgi:3-phenylpropionate/trans-cinnamate dioxygenase ferredoxin component